MNKREENKKTNTEKSENLENPKSDLDLENYKKRQQMLLDSIRSIKV